MLPRAAPALLLLSIALIGPGRGPCAGVVVLSPAPHRVLLAPEVEVSLLFHPPLHPRERVHVALEAGLDAPAGPELRDLSTALSVGPGRRRASLHATDLPPGRSRLLVGRGHPAFGRSAARGPRRASEAMRAAVVEHVLDRGGFSPEAAGGGGPFAAALHTASLSRVLGDGSARVLTLRLWAPTLDRSAPDPVFLAVPDAAVAAGAAALPVVVFSHGNCGLPSRYATLLSALARAGWLALATTHPGNTGDDPGCNTLPALIESFVQRPADLRAALDWLLAESGDVASPLSGIADPQRVAVAGHSFGALAAVRSAAADPRTRAVLALAPVFAPVAPLLAPILPLPLPAMLQVGANDATTPRATDALPLYEALVAPRFLVTLEGAGHAVFEDVCADPLPGVCPAGGHALAARFALAFLGRHVARDLRWASLLAPAPGAALAADP